MLLPAAVPGVDWLDAQWLLEHFALWFGPFMIVAVAAVVFMETGILVLSFLPGDSLLFTLGLLAATGHVKTPVWVICLVLGLSAFAGDQLAFTLGRRLGPKVFAKPKSRFFNPQNVQKTQEFFERHGGKAIILARFMPVLRAFVPVAAGVGRMSHAHFAAYNFIGAVLWTSGLTLLGYFLGQVPFVNKYSEYFILLILVLSVLPMLIEGGKAWLASLRRKRS